jgi:hypothetical protein
VFPNLAQAARAGGTKFLLTYNQFDSTYAGAKVGGVPNTSLGLPEYKTLYARNLAELVDTNGVLSLASGAVGSSPVIPSVAALQSQVWLKGRTNIAAIKALTASKAMGVMCVAGSLAYANPKMEVYWVQNSTSTGANLAFAVYGPTGARTIVASTNAILYTAWPPGQCFVNWFCAYDSTTGLCAVEFRDDGGLIFTDSASHVSFNYNTGAYPAFTGSLITDGSTAGAATTIVLTATTLVGTLALSSQFTIGGVVYTATAAATAVSNVLTVSVSPAVGAGGITASTPVAFTSGPLLNTTGNNGIVFVGHAFNGGVISTASIQGGLGIYSGVAPASTSVQRWNPALASDGPTTSAPSTTLFQPPAGFTTVCQTGNITSGSASASNVTGNSGTAGTINLGGPTPAVWNRNGGNGDIGYAAASLNPDGSTNTDVQAGGMRVMFLAGQVNDPCWDMFFNHAGGTGSYCIDWQQRWQPLGSYVDITTAMNSEGSKVWAPKGPTGGDLTIESWLPPADSGALTNPTIGLNFQGVDGQNIPNNNLTGSTSGTINPTTAMTLPGIAAGNGAWDQQTIIINSTGVQATSSVQLYVNGVLVGTATNVTNATLWNATEMYLSRSIYSGTQTTTTYTDVNYITIAVK